MILLFAAPVGVVTHDGLMYVVGGDDGTSNLSSVEMYNPKTDTWTLLKVIMSAVCLLPAVCLLFAIPQGRHGHRQVLHGRLRHREARIILRERGWVGAGN